MSNPHGREVLDWLRGPDSPLFKFLGFVRITELQVVVRFNPDGLHNPNHQDKWTGRHTFLRGYLGDLCLGLRLLLDCGPGKRCMDWSVGTSLSTLRKVFTSSAGLLLMDPAAAGHGFCSNVWHCRRSVQEADPEQWAAARRAGKTPDVPDATSSSSSSSVPTVSLQAGWAVPQAVRSGALPEGTAIGSIISAFFMLNSCIPGELKGSVLGGRLTAQQSAEARAAAAQEADEDAVADGKELEAEHCGWCAAHKDGAWRHGHGRRFCNACNSQLKHKDTNSAEEWAARPGALVCGAEGCARLAPEGAAGQMRGSGGAALKRAKNNKW